MISYAAVLRLDPITETRLFSVWEWMKTSQISNYGFTYEGKEPHITLADFTEADFQQLQRDLETYVSKRGSFEISLDMISGFEQSRTLYLTTSQKQPLYELHRSFLKENERIQMLEGSFYAAERWQPHLTIASRLEADKVSLVESHLKQRLPLNGLVIGIKVLKLFENEIGRVIGEEVVCEFNFK